MNNVIFSTSSESYPVSHIIYAGFIAEIPIEKRKTDQSHFFKIITSTGPTYCYYSNIDTAKRARSILGSMMTENKPAVFKAGNEIVDVSKIVSFTKVLTLKKPENGYTHAILLVPETVSLERSAQIWLHYKSEENARTARKALFGTILSLYQKDSSVSDKDMDIETAECRSE
jgi:hypothetical protein